GQDIEISLLTLAAQVVENEPGLHPDTDDKDAILTSLAQFDLLSNLVAIDAAASVESSVFYTSWARFRQERIQPIADRIATDPEFRKEIFGGSDINLALALLAVGKMAAPRGFGTTVSGDGRQERRSGTSFRRTRPQTRTPRLRSVVNSRGGGLSRVR